MKYPYFPYCLTTRKIVKSKIVWKRFIGMEIFMYKAILFLFFVVICLTAVVFTTFRDSFYSFL
jgi:hypothetical protein